MQHVTNRIKLAKAQSTKMKRFIRLKESTKLHLYKALIGPLMEYPIIPTGLTAPSNIIKMQRVQNKNLKFVAAYTENANKTVEEFHQHYKVEVINVRMYNAVNKLWRKMEVKDEELCNKSMRENNDQFLGHRWWKRTALFLEDGEPEPLYVQGHTPKLLSHRLGHTLIMTLIKNGEIPAS